MYKKSIKLGVMGVVLAVLTVALAVAAEHRNKKIAGKPKHEPKHGNALIEGKAKEKIAKSPSKKEIRPRGSDNATARDQGPPKLSDRKVDRLIKFAPLVCGEMVSIDKDGSIKVREVQCSPPTKNTGGDGKSTDESGEGSSGESGSGDSGGDNKEGGGDDSGDASTERGQKPGRRPFLPKQFQLVPAGDDVKATELTPSEKKPQHGGGSSGTANRRGGYRDDPNGGDSGGDTPFGPTVLMGKGDGSKKWVYLGSHTDADGERSEFWGDPNSELGKIFGWVDEKTPPANIDKPQIPHKPKKPKKPKDDKPKDK
jgi:hypothetical protein